MFLQWKINLFWAFYTFSSGANKCKAHLNIEYIWKCSSSDEAEDAFPVGQDIIGHVI